MRVKSCVDIAEKQVSSSSTESAAEESMVQILWGSNADLTETRLIGESIDSVLGGEELMEELEQKGCLLTTQSLGILMFDGTEQILVIVWEEPRIRQTSLSNYMVSEEIFMKQAMPELWIGCSLKKISDELG